MKRRVDSFLLVLCVLLCSAIYFLGKDNISTNAELDNLEERYLDLEEKYNKREDRIYELENSLEYIQEELDNETALYGEVSEELNSYYEMFEYMETETSTGIILITDYGFEKTYHSFTCEKLKEYNYCPFFEGIPYLESKGYKPCPLCH